MSFSSETRERTKPAVPLASMVDIMFLLLIFFMTASVFRQSETQIPVSLSPAATANPGGSQATRIVVTIDEDGRVYLGDRETRLEQLEGLFRKLATQLPGDSVTVLVRGDEHSALGQCVRVMDIAQQAGIQDVSIATIRPADQAGQE